MNEDQYFLTNCGIICDETWLLEQLSLTQEQRQYLNNLLRINTLLGGEYASSRQGNE